MPRFRLRCFSRCLLGPQSHILAPFKGPFSLFNNHLRQLFIVFASTQGLSINLHLFSIPYVQTQFNQMYVPEEASVQVNKPMEQIPYNQVMQQNCSATTDCPTALETLQQRESAGQKENEQNRKNLHSKGQRSSRMSLTNQRERNRERQRKRQTRLKRAFNVLRSVIPDHFSKREPGDRLSKIETLRLAKKYIATLQELLETC